MASCLVLPAVAGLCRTPGAEDRLRSLMSERAHVPFTWGVHDCCLFAADAIRALVGVDVAADFRGRYATELQAARVLHAWGGVEGLAREALGEPLRAPLLACLGDVGVVRNERRDVMAVCAGEWWAVPADRGMAVMPLQSARLAWRVGGA